MASLGAKLMRAGAKPAVLARMRRFLVVAGWKTTDAMLYDQIEGAARYVTGIDEKLPELSDWFPMYGVRLLEGMQPPDRFGPYDERVLDVLAASSPRALYQWLGAHCSARPKAPVFEAMVDAMHARGAWRDDDDIREALLSGLIEVQSAKGALNSAGRQLLRVIDAKGAHQAQERKALLPLLPSLVRHRRSFVLQQLDLDQPGRALAARTLLELDATRHGRTALAMVEGLRAKPALEAAYALQRHLPREQNAIATLLVAVIETSGNEQLAIEAVEVAWPWLKKGAAPVWSAFEMHTANDMVRFAHYATMLKQAKAFAVPWVVTGLVRPLDPSSRYGSATPLTYVTDILALLRRFDIAPHANRIVAALGRHPNRLIRSRALAATSRASSRASP
jgi:hypothetical protein